MKFPPLVLTAALCTASLPALAAPRTRSRPLSPADAAKLAPLAKTWLGNKAAGLSEPQILTLLLEREPEALRRVAQTLTIKPARLQKHIRSVEWGDHHAAKLDGVSGALLISSYLSLVEEGKLSHDQALEHLSAKFEIPLEALQENFSEDGRWLKPMLGRPTPDADLGIPRLRVKDWGLPFRWQSIEIPADRMISLYAQAMRLTLNEARVVLAAADTTSLSPEKEKENPLLPNHVVIAIARAIGSPLGEEPLYHLIAYLHSGEWGALSVSLSSEKQSLRVRPRRSKTASPADTGTSEKEFEPWDVLDTYMRLLPEERRAQTLKSLYAFYRGGHPLALDTWDAPTVARTARKRGIREDDLLEFLQSATWLERRKGGMIAFQQGPPPLAVDAEAPLSSLSHGAANPMPRPEELLTPTQDKSTAARIRLSFFQNDHELEALELPPAEVLRHRLFDGAVDTIKLDILRIYARGAFLKIKALTPSVEDLNAAKWPVNDEYAKVLRRLANNAGLDPKDIKLGAGTLAEYVAAREGGPRTLKLPLRTLYRLFLHLGKEEGRELGRFISELRRRAEEVRANADPEFDEQLRKVRRELHVGAPLVSFPRLTESVENVRKVPRGELGRPESQ